MKRIFPLSALLLVAGSRVILAQPPTGNAPKSPNPGNVGGVVARTPAEIAAEDKEILAGRADSLKLFSRINADLDAKTPAQDYEEMRRKEEPLLRQKFNQAGFNNLKLQDAVLDCVAAQEKSRLPVREAAAGVYRALRLKKVGDDEAFGAAMAAFSRALEVAQSERESATVALDGAVHFSANPRLEALLTLNGIVGEASYLTSDVTDLGDRSGMDMLPYRERNLKRRPVPVDPATLTPAQQAEEDKKYLQAYHSGQNMAREMMKMTPAQYREWKGKLAEGTLRRSLGGYGVKDPKIQEAIVAFVAAQEKSRAKVRAAAKAVYGGVAPQTAPVTPAAMSARLTKYIAVAEGAKIEREAATLSLDQAIGLAAKPRLAACLALDGLLGEASWFAGYLLPDGALSLDALDVIP